jgi:hypothetical protein
MSGAKFYHWEIIAPPDSELGGRDIAEGGLLRHEAMGMKGMFSEGTPWRTRSHADKISADMMENARKRLASRSRL